MTVWLLNAKSRVPSKQSTIPRLELMAATITARLVFETARSLTRPISKIVYWSESTTALAWIKCDFQWRTFIWNRLNEIRVLTDKADWRYVPTDLNPADLPSRGCHAARLVESRWWLDPAWLYNPESEWPETRCEVDERVVRSEVKKSARLTPLVSLNHPSFKVRDYFSSYSKLIKFLAWMHSFLKNRRAEFIKRKENPGGKISQAEFVYLLGSERQRLYLLVEK